MSQYTNPIRLRVSFERPESTQIVLQGPALEAYYAWMISGADEDLEELEELILDQCEGHIVMWTGLNEWDEVH